MVKGSHHSEESKRKLSISLQQSPRAIETRQILNITNTGRHRSEETRRKMSLAHAGIPRSDEIRRNISLGVQQSPKCIEARRKLWLITTGKPKSEEHKRKQSIIMSGRTLSEEHKYKISLSNKGKHLSEATKQKLRVAGRKRWRNPEYVAKVIKGWHIRPTKPELQLKAILDEHFPEFKYNGDYSLGIILGGMIPDFISMNGRKEVIELFSYHHTNKIVKNWKNTELGKIMLYKAIGFHCLVIWQKELANPEAIIERIRLWQG